MKFIYFIVFIFIFSGCSNSQSKVKEFFQTDNATHIKKDYHEIIKLLSSYKKKLDIRNPNNYDKNFAHYIETEFQEGTNHLFLKNNDKYINDYKTYLQMAFKSDIKNRNDYLILGLYKQIWQAYKLNESHQITALSYNQKELETLYYTLNVLRWKINTKKDTNGNYLFLTWQNNWQIELEQRIRNGEKPSWALIQNLNYILEEKETIYSQSNFNFNVLISQMIFSVNNSLKILGAAPLDITIEAMKGFVLFL